MTTYTFRSKYSFGTRVRYDSKFNGAGEGVIIGIALNEDASIYYLVQLDSGEVAGGILPEDVVESK